MYWYIYTHVLQGEDDEDSAWVWWTIYIFILVLSLVNLVTSLVLCRYHSVAKFLTDIFCLEQSICTYLLRTD